MKKGFRKFWAAALAAVTVVSMTACGGDAAQTDSGKNKEKSGSNEREFVYVPEYISFAQSREGEAGRYNFSFVDNKIYYNMYIETETGGYTGMFSYDIAAGTEEEVTIEELSENMWRQCMTVDAAGNQYVVWSEWVVDENNPDNSYNRYNLVKYDVTAATVYSVDLTNTLAEDEENSYIQSIAVDEQGRVYLQSSQVVFLVDAEGNLKGKVTTGESWINSMVLGRDGKVCVAYYDWTAADSGYVGADVDFDTAKLGTTYALPTNGGALAAGPEGRLLISDENSLYTYDKTTATAEKVLDWLDSDINGSYVEAIYAVEDGRILVVINSWDTGVTELAYLKKTAASEVVKKTELTVGVLYSSQELSAAAVNFNKTNEKYRVNIKTYYDFNSDMEYTDAITAMNNDLVSGSGGPDIIALDGDALSAELLMGKGILEDLAPYLEKSTVLNRADMVESILESYTYDGKLSAIPKYFGIATIAGKTSVIGDRMSWTVQDVIALAAQYPDAELFEYTDRSEMMNMLMMLNQEEFIDWENGSCDFNNDEFKQMLEFAAGFPAEYDWEAETESTPVKLGSGKLLLYTDNISSIMDIQVSSAMFGEPITYIGYPVSGEGTGCFMHTNGCYGIAARSENKDGAWEFIESYLATEDSMFGYGFSIMKERIEADIAEAMKVEYITDENGDPILDENGAPMIQSSGGFGYDDWMYDYRPATEEEREILWELIDMAEPLPAQSKDEVMNIINEAAEPFYSGQKSVDDVATEIQSRISMYVSENS